MSEKCICGNDQFQKSQKSYWRVTPTGLTRQAKGKMIIGECSQCGIIRQMDLQFSNIEEYIRYYQEKYPPVNKSYKTKTYEHDIQLAKLRCDDYDIFQGNDEKMLDAGSGSGAFVKECRDRGADAYGCEVSEYAYSPEFENNYVYKNRLEDVNFPTDYFTKVTCHDVVEHILNPVQFIMEAYRTLRQGGNCFIELPRFFDKSGKHHWKKEHIWYFTTEQFKKILERIGFIITEIKHPIESKTAFHCIKPAQDRPTILYPPGIGDCYWSIVKTQAFLKREGLDIPDIYVVHPRDRKYQGHKRSFPFLQMFPFLNSTGINFGGGDPGKKAVWNEAYARRGRTIFKNIMGYDYFISYNGHLKYGESLDKIDKDLKCNWFPPMFTSLEQEHYRNHCIKRYGKYIIFYFAFQGTYINWIKQFSVDATIEFIKRTTKKTGLTPVFIGAMWDKESKKLNHVKASVPGCVDLVGKTTLSQLFGLIKGSQMVFGYPSGATIMAVVLKQKTLILWNDYYHQDFFWNACPPFVKNKTYFIENTKTASVNNLTKRVSNILMNKEYTYKPIIMTEKKLVSVIDISKVIDMPVKLQDLSRPTITVMCVLKSGGSFTVDYVRRLRNMITRNTTLLCKFLCLTDIKIDPAICDSVRLIHNQEGWWSKIELFRPGLADTERIIYLDLDTVIISNIDDVLSLGDNFITLQPWNKHNRKKGMYASGMMGWENNNMYSFLYSSFEEKHKTLFAGDQQYLSNKLKEAGIDVSFFQNQVDGIHSYKRECSQNLPTGAKIVCFHGRPRPHKVKNPWIEEHWR